MPIAGIPLTTNDAGLDKVLASNLPVVLYLYEQPNTPLEQAFKRAAQANAETILVARVDVGANSYTRQRFGKLTFPALVTLDEGRIESKAEGILPEDVMAHVDFLLGEGPYPTETAAQVKARAANGTHPAAVTDQSFDGEVLHSSVPVLVDFWAPWCGPCQMDAPTLERLAEKYTGQVKIVKLNVDENPQTAQHYRAMSIPLLLLFKNGKVVDRLVGAHPQPAIEVLIKKALL